MKLSLAILKVQDCVESDLQRNLLADYLSTPEPSSDKIKYAYTARNGRETPAKMEKQRGRMHENCHSVFRHIRYCRGSEIDAIFIRQ